MIDPRFTSLARQRLHVTKPVSAVWGSGAGIRARLSSFIEEVEKWPTPDERIPQVLAWLRKVEPQAATMEPLLVQSRIVEVLEAILEMEEED
jgi:hypothetical protein